MSDLSNSLTGTIKVIKDTQSFASGFCKREFVVTVEDGKYPQEINLELIKDKCDLLDQFSEGQEVTVHYNLRGSEYNGRYFVNLQAWKLEGGSLPRSSKPKPSPEPQEEDDTDDIPF